MSQPTWKIVTARFDPQGKVLVKDPTGSELFLGRAELREMVESGVVVYSVSRFRLTVAYVDAGRLM